MSLLKGAKLPTLKEKINQKEEERIHREHKAKADKKVKKEEEKTK